MFSKQSYSYSYFNPRFYWDLLKGKNSSSEYASIGGEEEEDDYESGEYGASTLKRLLKSTIKLPYELFVNLPADKLLELLYLLAAIGLGIGYKQASNAVPSLEGVLYPNGSESRPYFVSYPGEIKTAYNNFINPRLLTSLIQWLGASTLGPIELFIVLYSAGLFAKGSQKLYTRIESCLSQYKREEFGCTSIFYTQHGKNRWRFELPKPFGAILKHAPPYLFWWLIKSINRDYPDIINTPLGPHLDNATITPECPVQMIDLLDCETSVIKELTGIMNGIPIKALMDLLEIAIPTGAAVLLCKQIWDVITRAIERRVPEKVAEKSSINSL